MYEILILLIFPGAMAAAAASDLITMTISNWISIALIAGFAALALWAGLSLETVGMHVLIGFSALIAGFTCFAMGWIGGGDAKLFAATALWFGLTNMVEYTIFAALLGGGLTIGLLLFRTIPLPAGLARQHWIGRLHSPEDGVPYGLALAAAGLIVYPQSIWMS